MLLCLKRTCSHVRKPAYVDLSSHLFFSSAGHEMPFSLQLPRFDQQEQHDSDDDEDNETEDPMGLAEKEDGWQAPRIGSMRHSVDIENIAIGDFLILRAPQADVHSFKVGAVDTPLWLCQVYPKPETVSTIFLV